MPYAMQIPRPGGPEVFKRIATPRAQSQGRDSCWCGFTAVGVNFIETYQRKGVYAVDYPLSVST
jgi:NADPH2:quinone reductase